MASFSREEYERVYRFCKSVRSLSVEAKVKEIKLVREEAKAIAILVENCIGQLEARSPEFW